MNTLTGPLVVFLSVVFLTEGFMNGKDPEEEKRPNILVCIADDASFPHMGEACSWIHTPAFNRIAREGLAFMNAYTPSAKCAPSRACILTGRNPWQLKEAANHFCFFPPEFQTYAEALNANGYFVGHTAKGWGPGVANTKSGEPRELTGRAWNELRTDPPTTEIVNIDYAANFAAFYHEKPPGEPFCFWYGGIEPHRKYEYASSIRAGRKTSEIDIVPAFFPDNETVRTDLLDYGLEIEYFDLHVGRILQFLEEQGEMENTIIIVTSDNGMPFPHAKSDAYDHSNHMPMAIMWKNGIRKPGRIIGDYVSFIDLAPTFLDLAGVNWEKSGMMPTPGKSLKPLFNNPELSEPFREFVLIGKERHDVGRPDDYGYPIRGILSEGWLYLVNYRNELWPAGNPETGYPTVAGSPTKTEVLRTRKDPASRHFWELSFGKRMKEELFDLRKDVDCIHNLACEQSCDSIRDEMRRIMVEALEEEADPRMFGKGDIFHSYAFSDERWRNLYQRMVVDQEDIYPGWINKSDIETGLTESQGF